jgi:hypothetical protein
MVYYCNLSHAVRIPRPTRTQASGMRELVVIRIHKSGFEDSNLFANFSGEREDSNLKAKDSNLCCQVKRTQNCSRSSKFGNLDDF